MPNYSATPGHPVDRIIIANSSDLYVYSGGIVDNYGDAYSTTVNGGGVVSSFAIYPRFRNSDNKLS